MQPRALMAHRPTGIKARLVALIFIALLPAIVFAIILLAGEHRHNREALRIQIREESQQLSQAVDFELRRTIAKLEVLGFTAALANGDLKRFDAVARRVLAADPGWNNLVLIDATGRQLVNGRVAFGRPLGPLNRPEFAIQAARTGHPVVSDMALAAVARRQLTAVYVPVKQEGATKYVLAAAIEPHSWNALLKGRLSSRARALLLDTSGALVTSTANAADDVEPVAFTQPAAPAAARTTIERNVAQLRAAGAVAEFDTSGFSGWSVVAYVPREILGPAGPALSTLALGTFVLLAFGIGAALYIGRDTARSITDLVGSVKEVASGAAPLPLRTNLLEVRQANDVLVGVAAQLAATLRQQQEIRARLESADRAKNDFLAMLGHELRNPLSAMRTGLEVARRSAPSQDARLMRALTIVDRQSSQMVRLVSDLLDISRIEQRKIDAKLEPLDLRAAVAAVAEDHAGAAAAADVELRVELTDSPVTVRGDRERLAQLFGNLLHNALKFTPAGGSITMGLRAEDDAAIASVRDTGAGIEPDMLEAIFEPFVQAKQDGARAGGGIGLGLALVKALAELHSGTAQAHSAGKGQGAEFLVRIPLAG